MLHRLPKPYRGVRLNQGHPFARGLVGAWLMNERIGSQLFDYSGFEHPGTCSGTEWGVGNNLDGLIFDAYTDYIDLGATAIIDGATEFTLNLVFSCNNAGADNGLFYIGQHTTSQPLVFWLDNAAPDHFAMILTDGGGQTTGAVYSAFVPVVNVPYNITLVFRGSVNTRLYIDGVEDTGSDFPVSHATVDDVASGSTYTIGNQDSHATKGADGIFSHVYLWNRAFSSGEVQTLCANPYAMFEHESRAQLFYVAAGGGLSINVFDSISIAEALTPDQPLGPVSVNETLTIAEFLSLLLQIAPNVFDTVTVAEFVQAVMSIKPEVFDTITIAESVALLKDILPSIYDEITITEYINLALSGVGINVNDTITVTEYVNLLFELKAIVNDTITVSEFVSMFISSAGVNAFDLVSVQEYVNLQFSDMEISVNDTISIVESIVMSMSMSLNVYDAIAITENIVTAMDLGPVSVNEGISITEAITLAISPHYLSVSDTITISEWVQVMSSLISGLLSMTFTAKKPRIVFTAKKPSMTFTARKPRINFS